MTMGCYKALRCKWCHEAPSVTAAGPAACHQTEFIMILLLPVQRLQRIHTGWDSPGMMSRQCWLITAGLAQRASKEEYRVSWPADWQSLSLNNPEITLEAQLIPNSPVWPHCSATPGTVTSATSTSYLAVHLAEPRRGLRPLRISTSSSWLVILGFDCLHSTPSFVPVCWILIFGEFLFLESCLLECFCPSLVLLSPFSPTRAFSLSVFYFLSHNRCPIIFFDLLFVLCMFDLI